MLIDDCLLLIIQYNENNQYSIWFGITCKKILSLYRFYYQKIKMVSPDYCLIDCQYCSCLSEKFEPTLSIIYKIIERRKIISLRWILNNHFIPPVIFNPILKRINMGHRNADLCPVLFDFMRDKIMPRNFNVYTFMHI